jgi:NADP-dependent 3-hydroxy acid dehydrogenase YdfG
MSETTRVALVTGASSGIGEATVRSLAAEGFQVVAAARRVERCEEVAQEVGGRALRLDVADPDSVAELAESLPEVSVVVNNAGGALGLEPVSEADEENWRQMYETNVMGRFEGDQDRAGRVYEGTTPLSAEDVADAIAYVVTRPPHVDVDYLSIKPTKQATARDVHRR